MKLIATTYVCTMVMSVCFKIQKLINNMVSAMVPWSVSKGNDSAKFLNLGYM